MTITRKSASRNTNASNLNDLLDESTETEKSPTGEVFADAPIAARLAAEVLSGKFRHATGLGWLRWDGKRWQESAGKDARELARRWVEEQFNTAADAWKTIVTEGSRSEAARAQETADGWKRYLAKTKLDAVVDLASGIQGVTTDPGKLDACPDKLNTQTGVVDLATGELQPHDPDLLLTKITRAGFEPGAEHRDWKTALEAVPADVLDWYQIRLGQAVTGHTPPDDVMLVQQGGGENGKTTVMGAIEKVLGDYYLAVPHRALLADSRAHTTELTEFRGARLAVLEETPEERQLNVTRLKMLVGTPTMTARKIAQDTIRWEASHTLAVNTNYRPSVNETDHGTWRRLALLTFPYRFVGKDADLLHENDRRGDEGLRQRLRQGKDGQAEAVLAWLVAGAVRWYAADRVLPSLPARVAAETRDWREESDVLYSFLADELVPNANSYVLAEDLYEEFGEWLAARGHKPWSSKTIAARIEQHVISRELGMTKERIRTRPGRSYRPDAWLGETDKTPEQFTAWTGVRFTRDQTGLESVSVGIASSWHTEASDQPESGSVQGVQAVAEVPRKNPSRKDRVNHPAHPAQGRRNGTRRVVRGGS
jgi:putative DNA primase/helicase